MISRLDEFEGKALKAADRGELEKEDEASDDTPEEMEGFFTFMKTALPGLKEVRTSKRLRESAAVLVADDYGMSAHMERLMKRMGRGDELPPPQRILELNVEHEAVKAVQALYDKDPSDPRVEDYANLFYEQAVIAEGSTVEDPAAMAARVNRLIAKAGEGRA